MRAKRETGIALITSLLVLMLMASITVGFCWLVVTDQSESGNTNQRGRAFYGAEAGMEELTASLFNLFGQNYAPSAAQVNALVALPKDPLLPDISYVDPAVGTPGSGYAIAFQPDKNGNPLAQNQTITAGTYQGMEGLLTPYTLTVIAHTGSGAEVKLQRSVQTVGIPIFQFGIFSQTDLSFFAGPNFSFGGRVHTNGNLYLAEGGGATLTLGDKVSAVGEVIRTNLSNGWLTSSSYTGTVNALKAPGSYRAMAMGDGSLKGTLGSPANPNWQNLSIGTYHGYVRDGDLAPPQYTGVNSTGTKPLNLTIATPAIGGSPIDMIRRPVAGELGTNPGKLGERYFAQASLRILISDNPLDITGLPCETATPPVDLSLMAQPLGSWPAAAPYSTIKAALGASAVPLAASGAGATYSATDGYWVKGGAPIIKGFIKIEAQTTYGSPCGTYVDVTPEILGLGYAGRNIDPVNSGSPLWKGAAPTLPLLPGGQVASSGCLDPNPNAIIRFERVRDNPSTQATSGGCGVAAGVVPVNPNDYWPNALFDAREGNPRDWCPNGGPGGGACKIQPTLAGVMYYVELDVNNLERWFTGAIGVTGPATKDNVVSPNDFSVYFSDRRDNYIAAPLPSLWPPASPSGNETGEYGFNDFVNSASPSGCPNGALDTGESLDAPNDVTVQTYGALAALAPYPLTPGGAYATGNLLTAMGAPFNSIGTVLSANWKCTGPFGAGVPWPGYYVKNTQEARENPALFFRRALKLVHGSTINLGLCPNNVNCGLAITSENPVYVEGNYNAPGGAFVAPYGAASIIADAVTLLSNKWNDVNSFSSTYNTGGRNGATTAYRVAIAAGKGISFPQPGGYATYQDFGTDGGVHNFLRFLENWGSTLNYRGSIVSLYYNRQDTGVYKCCTTVYGAPTRGYNFDSDFLTPALLPPRTPMFRDINTVGFTEYILPQ